MKAVLKAAVASVQKESNSSDSRDVANLPGRNAPPLAQSGAGLFQGRDGPGGKRFLYILQLRAACNDAMFLDFSLDQHRTQEVVLFPKAQLHHSKYCLMEQC